MIKFVYDEQPFCFINVYAPNQDKEKICFFEKLTSIIKKHVNDELDQLIIGGDMNTMCDPIVDNIAGENPKINVVDAFKKFREECCLTDVWRHLHPQAKEFTWKRNSPFIARRLDYLFVNNTIIGKCIKAEIKPFPCSDHEMVCMKVNTQMVKRGPGYWKLNNNMLMDQNFVCMINDVIAETVEKYEGKVNPQILWDVCKVEIKNVAANFSRRATGKRRSDLFEIEKKLEHVHRRVLEIHATRSFHSL